MKNKILYTTAIAGLFASCQGEAKKDNAIDSASTAVVESVQSLEECYSMTKNKDTATLSLKLSGDKATGTLTYNLFEKDKNTGSIEGIMMGDTLIANYTFMSEGVTSVREVAFLRKDNELMEGFGDVTSGTDTVKFQNPKAITFGKSLEFTKTDCK